jgi:hypothetical protein
VLWCARYRQRSMNSGGLSIVWCGSKSSQSTGRNKYRAEAIQVLRDSERLVIIPLLRSNKWGLGIVMGTGWQHL